jgi:hypothetical protein
LILVPSLQTGNAILEVLPPFYQKRQSLYIAFLVRDKERGITVVVRFDSRSQSPDWECNLRGSTSILSEEAEPLYCIPSLRVLRASAVRFLLLFNPPPKDPNPAAENKPSTPQLTAYQ